MYLKCNIILSILVYNINKLDLIYMGEDYNIGITGKWINKITGQVINVRNSVIDGDNMIIISDAGQIMMSDFSQNYVQASDEIYDESGHVVDNKPVEISEIVNNEQSNYVSNNLINMNSPIQQEVQNLNVVESENDKIIEKVFKKIKNEPKISVNIEWDDFPESQLNTLIEFLDIPMDDISSYIIKHYITDEQISKCLSQYLSDKLS